MDELGMGERGMGGRGLEVDEAWRELRRRLADRVAGMMDAGGSPALTRVRHREALEECRAALGRCLAVLDWRRNWRPRIFAWPPGRWGGSPGGSMWTISWM